MEENIKFIYEDIINATSNSNDLLEELKSIKGPSIIIGNGGSEVVATFLAKVLSKKNHLITSVHDSCNLSSLELSNYENIIITSYSGTNHGVKNVFNYNLKCTAVVINPNIVHNTFYFTIFNNYTQKYLYIISFS